MATNGLTRLGGGEGYGKDNIVKICIGALILLYLVVMIYIRLTFKVHLEYALEKTATET